MEVSNTTPCDSWKIWMIEVKAESGAFLYSGDDLDTIACLWDIGLWDNPEIDIIPLIVGIWEGRGGNCGKTGLEEVRGSGC